MAGASFARRTHSKGGHMKKALIGGLALAAFILLALSSAVFAYEAGENVEVLWKGTWYKATVLSTKGAKTCIHYDGYGKNWDECVGGERIRGGAATAAATTGVKFGVGDPVKVLWKGSWYDASVIDVNAKKGKYKITYKGYDKSWDEWVGNDRIKAR